MKPDDGKNSLFSAGKPKNLPWFYFPLIIGVVAVIILYKFLN